VHDPITTNYGVERVAEAWEVLYIPLLKFYGGDVVTGRFDDFFRKIESGHPCAAFLTRHVPCRHRALGIHSQRPQHQVSVRPFGRLAARRDVHSH